MRLGKALWISALAFACGGGPDDNAREAEIASVLSRADIALIRARPKLVAGKYRLMTTELISFYRGNVPLFLHDFRDKGGPLSRSRFAMDAPLVLGTCDPHIENFGLLLAPDGSLGLEPNDFDAADFVPYLYEVRRWIVSLVVAAHASNPSDSAAHQLAVDARRAIARAGAVAYANTIRDLANGAPRTRLDAPPANDPIMADLWKRAIRDTTDRAELVNTTVTNGVRVLKRGVLDPADPTNTYADLPNFAVKALPQTLAQYRQSLIAPPPPEYFTVLDAVREFGSGVASWPRVRLIVLVRGPSDDVADDVMLEVKEESDSPVSGWYPPGLYFDTIQSRITNTSRAMWSRPDAAPLWGASEWLGFPVQVRLEATGQKTIRASRLIDDRGTVAALTTLATDLGSLLARVHSAPSKASSAPAAAIWARIGSDPDGFADEQADAATDYGDQVTVDFALFSAALKALGPTLGVELDASDAPPADLAAVYGDPP
jgi:uncharacterized protein (DUF2252 family)